MTLPLKFRNLKANRHILCSLKNCSPKMHKGILKSCPKETIFAILDIIYNTLNGKLRLTPLEKKRLARYKIPLRKIISHSTSLPLKRKILVQSGSGFLGLIIGSLLSSAIGNLINRDG